VRGREYKPIVPMVSYPNYGKRTRGAARGSAISSLAENRNGKESLSSREKTITKILYRKVYERMLEETLVKGTVLHTNCTKQSSSRDSRVILVL